MKWMKKTAAVLLAVVMLLSAIPLQAYADTSSIRSKRIVSVVYDDSGSMTGDKAVRANYAMQAFIGMLDRNDEMYITFMKQPSKAKSINLSDPQKSVDTMRKHGEEADTPVGAVSTAFDTLKSCSDKNTATEYWLLVFTDGDYSDETLDKFQRRLGKYADTKMPNGSKPHIQYMTIGDEDGKFTPGATRSNIAVKQALSNNDITQNIFDISSEITGRFRVDAGKIQFVDDKTVQVTAEVPLLNIGVLTQNTNAKVVSVEAEEGKSVPIKSNVAIRSPGKDNISAKGAGKDAMSLKGNVATAGYDGENIPACTYTIRFDKKVAQSDIVVMHEPALELRIKVFSGDKEADIGKSISGNDKNLNARAIVYEMGTDNEIDMSLIPSGAKSEIKHTEDGKTVEENNTLTLDTLTVTNGKNVITAKLSVAGYFTLKAKTEFNASTLTVTDVKPSLHYDGSPRIDTPFKLLTIFNLHKKKPKKQDAKNVVYVSEMSANKTGIKFTVYDNGSPLTKDQADAYLDAFRLGVQCDFSKYDVEVMKDGSFLVYPTKKTKWFGNLTYYLKNKGERTVSVKLEDKKAQGKLFCKVGYLMSLILPIIILLIIIWHVFFKKRFRLCKVWIYKGHRGGRRGRDIIFEEARSYPLTPLSAKLPILAPLFWPFSRSAAKAGPFTVKATHGLLGKIFNGFPKEVEIFGLENYRITKAAVGYEKPGPNSKKVKSKTVSGTIYLAKSDNETFYRIEIS